MLVSAAHQCDLAVSTHRSLALESPSHPPRLSQTGVELPVLCSKFPLAICFTSGYIYVFMLVSHSILLSPCPTVSTGLFSMTVSLLSRAFWFWSGWLESRSLFARCPILSPVHSPEPQDGQMRRMWVTKTGVIRAPGSRLGPPSLRNTKPLVGGHTHALLPHHLASTKVWNNFCWTTTLGG